MDRGSAGLCRSRRLRGKIVEFWRCEDGIITVETLFILPLMLSVMFMLYGYWDGYRAKTLAQNANYVVADIISRETSGVTPAFLAGMHQVFGQMVMRNDPSHMRVSSIGFDGVSGNYRVLWSRSSNQARYPALTNQSHGIWLEEVAPKLETGATLILVETWQDYRSPLSHILQDLVFYTRNFVWPRVISPMPLTSS